MLLINRFFLVGAGGVAYHSIAGLSKLLIVSDQSDVIDPDIIDPVHVRQWPGAMAGVEKAAVMANMMAFYGMVGPNQSLWNKAKIESVWRQGLGLGTGRPSCMTLALTDNGISRRFMFDKFRDHHTGTKARGRIGYYVSAGNGAKAGWAAWWPVHVSDGNYKIWRTMMDDILGPANGVAPKTQPRGRQAPCGGEQTLLANLLTAQLVCTAIAAIGDYQGREEDKPVPTMFYWAATDKGVKTWTEGPKI